MIHSIHSLLSILLLAKFVAAQDTLLSSGPWSKREGLMGASLGNVMMMAGGRTSFGVGFSNDVWISENGTEWIQQPKALWGPRAYHMILEQDGCAIAMGGQTFKSFFNDVWKSCDQGKSWEQLTAAAEWQPRSGLAGLHYKGNLIVAGGCYNNAKGKRSFLNDVWSSTDGKTWNVLTNSAEWGGRSGPRLASFKDQLYLVAGEIGFTPTTQLADVWVSDTGASWTLVSSTPGYSARSGHGVISFPDRMLLLAGWPELHDAYATTDGIAWKKVSDKLWNCDSENCGKYDFWSLVHKGDLYTLGGSGTYSTFGKLYRDTWKLDLTKL